jgi:hypothetical protein
MQRWISCYIISKESFIYTYIRVYRQVRYHNSQQCCLSRIQRALLRVLIKTQNVEQGVIVKEWSWNTHTRNTATYPWSTELLIILLVPKHGMSRCIILVERCVTSTVLEDAGLPRSLHNSQWRGHNCSCEKIVMEKLKYHNQSAKTFFSFCTQRTFRYIHFLWIWV